MIEHLFDKMVDHIFVFEGDGIIRDYHYTYSEYRIKKEQEERKQSKINAQEKPKETRERKRSKKPSYRQLKRKEELELLLEKLELEKNDLEQNLASGKLSADEITKVSAQYGLVKQNLDDCFEEWMLLEEEIQQILKES
jgi:ATP-binding cassette subfamily F protein uup